ncbi:MAG: extracellular solute-binding protein [Phycisphaerae bacterium]|nr:extracellular solute-binding protein [Phycisphaerae bacterium]
MTVDYSEQSNQQELTNPRTPLHRRIAENLSNRINGGELKPGNKLPSERQIAHQFNASRATVRTALQHLEQEGLITRRDRRSAIVTLRRDIQPNLRIACTSPRLKEVLRLLGEKQLMPPRCQLQLLDIRRERAISELVTQPASGADILLCDLEYANCMMGQEEMFTPFPASVVSDSDMPMALRESFVSGGFYKAVPLGVSPMVLYYNKAMVNEVGVSIPQGPWHWDQLADIARRFVGNKFGFQIRPKYSHYAALVAGFGGELYRADGKVGVNESDGFCAAFRFIEDLITSKAVAPVGYDHIDLFAEKRCGMAMEGYDKYNEYRKALGEDLGIAILPGAKPAAAVVDGFVLMVMKGMENLQPVEDMLRTLMLANTQTIMVQEGVALPICREVLSATRLHDAGLSNEAVNVFTAETGSVKPANRPESIAYGQSVEKVIQEMHLGLLQIDELCGQFKSM